MPLEREIKVLNPKIDKNKLLESGASYSGIVDIEDKYLRSPYEQRIFRLRKEGSRYYFGYKTEDRSSGRHKERFEETPKISRRTAEVMRNIGLEERVVLHKNREKFSLDDMKISLDHVDDFGDIRTVFEVEYNSYPKLVNFLQKLGIDETAFEKKDTYQLLCEKKLGEYQSIDEGVSEVVRRVEKIRNRKQDENIIIGVSGASGSGKTTVSEAISKKLDGKLLSLDRYYVKDAPEIAKNLGGNWDHPSLIDFELINEHLKKIKNGEPIDTPLYEFETGKRKGYEKFEPSNITVAESIYAFYPTVLDENPYDLTVATFSSTHLNLIRRLIRDIKRSKQTQEQILGQVANTVFPMYTLFIEPNLKKSDIKIFNTYNPLNIQDSDFQVKIPFTYFEKIKSVFDGELKLSKKTKQVDTIFSYSGEIDPEEEIQVRCEDNKNFLRFKMNASEKGDIKKRLNYECLVGSNASINLLFLGYKSLGEIEKEREEYELGKTKVRLDNVKNLGKFIELKSQDKSDIELLLKRLGVKEEDVIKKTYSNLHKSLK